MCYQTFGVLKKPPYFWEKGVEEDDYEVVEGEEEGFWYERIGEREKVV